MSKPVVRTYFDRKRVRKEFPGVSRTKQSAKDECDINKIYAKYKRTGQLPSLIQSDPRFGDFSDVPSYQESLDRVMHAQEQFLALPAAVRKRFDNDPAKFLEFASDKKNGQVLVELGLATPREVETTLKDVLNALKGDSKAPKGAAKATKGAARGATPGNVDSDDSEED